MSAPGVAKILVVDDTPANVKLLVDVLTVSGYAASAATNGEDALTQIAASPPDLVLLDIMMPGIDGVEALGLLRAEPRTATLKVVAFTASVMAGDRSRVTQAGFDGFVSKPINLKEFVATIARLTEAGVQ